MVSASTTSPDRAAAKRFIEELHSENHAFYSGDLGRGALKDLQQTFAHPWLYVGELLQNAVDAGAKKISLRSEDSTLVFDHDGGAFSEPNVKALCARGLSTKGAGTVGFMGIGFKAVFQSFECAEIASGPWKFRLCVKEEVGEEYGDRQRDWLGCVLPEDAEELSEPSTGMRCRFTLRNRLDGLGPIHDDVQKVLSEDLLVLALLARRGVEEFRWNGQTWTLSQSENPLDEQNTRVILTAKDAATEEERRWVLFSTTYQPTKKAIRRFLEHRQIRPKPEERENVYAEARQERCVDVFCLLDEQGMPAPSKHAQAYALLATNVAAPIGLHLQADWLLVTSRRELMEVETNEWHQEILARLPTLLRSYLKWVSSLSELTDQQLANAYAVLPDWEETDGALGPYVNAEAFRDALRTALADLDFLPVRRSEGRSFIAPNTGKALPPALREFDDDALLPWALFGGDTVSTALLGARTRQSLEALNLLQPLTPEDLAQRWNSGEVGRWREQLGDDATRQHVRLLGALASLDEDESWREAPLRCLLTASGDWLDRQSATGLPKDWDSIPEEPPLRTWLEPYLPPSETRLEWSFDRAVQRDTDAGRYTADLTRADLDTVFQEWWDALPDEPDEDACLQILDTTHWVLEKQRQRPGLVKRVLCNDQGRAVLVKLPDAVLAEPYASGARQHFFPSHPPVTERYLEHKEGHSEADWRSFFEATPVTGPLRLQEEAQELSKEGLRAALSDYEPRETRATWMRARWEGHTFIAYNYLLTNVTLPEELGSILTGTVTPEDARAAAAWLNEARQQLPSKAKRRVVYVPYGTSYTSRDTTNEPTAWVQTLTTARWIFERTGAGPYTPEQVLARTDPARPDAPVADLPEELVTILERCGIAFGGALPDVASIDRLQREGSTADTERLLELLDQALADTKEDGRDELAAVLRTTQLVPVPVESNLIDGAARVRATRLVQRTAPGAELGGWLISTQAATKNRSHDDPYARLLQLVSDACDIPENPTGEQALAFLQWIWRNRPEADRVRRILPRLFRLVADDLRSGSLEQDTWDAARADAAVYTANRQWVRTDHDNLYLDDLDDDHVKTMRSELILATPGHLGESASDQRRVAALLGVTLLSSRFQVALDAEDEQALPEGWQARLDGIIELLRSYAQEEEDAPAITKPDVQYYRRIQKVLVEEGAEKTRWDVHAARYEDRICLAGDPDDFAADLCGVLLSWAGLAGRRDLHQLAPTLTQLIGWLGKPKKFTRRLKELRAQRGLTPSEEIETPAPEKEPEHKPPEKPERKPPGKSEPIPDKPDTPTPSPDEPDNETEPETPESSPPDDEEADIPPTKPGGRHTPRDRESRLRAIRKKRDALNAQLEELLAAGPLPADSPEDDEEDHEKEPGKFESDEQYRQATVEYEEREGRFAEKKDTDQAGYDIDSYDKPLDDAERKLVRRIEVKGRGRPWEDDETVLLSDRQFRDALTRRADGVTLADDFDYWLYVVERREDGALHVIPIKNPALRAAKFEFRGGTWRELADESETDDE